MRKKQKKKMLKPNLPKLTPKEKEICLLYLSFFRINGVSVDKIVTDGQLVIFAGIVLRKKKYLEIICYTQYGKSLFVALACIIISCLHRRKIPVIAPSAAKAKIIMRYYIEHLGDNKLFYSKLEKNTKLERLRQEESKDRIILRNGGGIFALSVDQRNSKKSIEAAMGEGGEIVIIDEACLIQDDTEATLFRMITGKPAKDKLYCKIGNPFYSDPPNSHFFKSWEDERFERIYIDYNVGIEEGRITQEEIDVAKEKPLFDILYSCDFPPEGLVDIDGFQKLVLNKDIRQEEGLKEKIQKAHYQDFKVGGDIGAGGDENVYILRYKKIAVVVGVTISKDVMINVREIERINREWKVPFENFNLDDVGVGAGVVSRCHELGYNVKGVSAGARAVDHETFANLRAEMAWGVKNWCESGGQLERDINWNQLTWIKYKQQTGEKKIILESKEKQKARTKKSPNHYDALALTFYEAPFMGIVG